MRRKGNRCCALFPKQGSDSRCGAGRQAAGHQQGGGLQDELHILAHLGHAGHVLPVQLLKGVRHVLTELLPTKGAGGQILLQIGPQVRLILVVAEHTVGIILVMGIGERIRQIVGQFAQGVILPDGPALAALEPGDAGVDVVLGVGVVMTPELIGPQGALLIGQGVAVRLKGAEQEGGLESSGLKSLGILQQGGGQQFVTAFLQDAPPWKKSRTTPV